MDLFKKLFDKKRSLLIGILALVVLFLFLVPIITTQPDGPEYENAVTFQAELIETKMTTSFPVLTISEDGAQLRELRLQSDTLIRASDGTVIPPSQADRLTPGAQLNITAEKTGIYEPVTTYIRCYEIQVLE